MANKRAVSKDVEYRALGSDEDDTSDLDHRPISSLEIGHSDLNHAKTSSDALHRRDSDADLSLPDSSHGNHHQKCCWKYCCCCCRCCRWLCCTSRGIVILLSTFTMLLGAGIFLYIACRPVPYVSNIVPLTTEPAAFNNTVNVFLVGDSMWGIPQVSKFNILVVSAHYHVA